MDNAFVVALTGISGILVTPFNDKGEIAPGRLEPIVLRMLDAGVHLPVVNGNTSEFYALTSDEACEMVKAAVAIVSDRAPVLAGVGRGIRDACDIARRSVSAGAAGIMIHQPPDPFVSPRGIIDYVQRVSEVVDGTPIVLYLRNDAIGIEAIADLCSIANVVGVKWATPNPMKLSEAISMCSERIVWIAGLAETWAPTLYSVGARGFTSGLVNVWPERSVEIHAALGRGDYVSAGKLIAEIVEFENLRAEEMSGTNVSVVKSALQLMGVNCGVARPPSAWPLTVGQQERLGAFMRDTNLI